MPSYYLSEDLALKALGEKVLFTLPSGEIRAAFLVRAIDKDTADIRVLTAGVRDAEYFAGAHEVQFLAGASYGAGEGQWSWPAESMMATLWPH